MALSRFRHYSHAAFSSRAVFFFFNDPATPEIYALSLHDALPISARPGSAPPPAAAPWDIARYKFPDRKSTRLNSSHDDISYAVFCLKKKQKTTEARPRAKVALHPSVQLVRTERH